jgi:hypothetical protein
MTTNTQHPKIRRLWITARLGFAGGPCHYRQLALRRVYRELRTVGLSRHAARMAISDILFAGHQESIS